MPEENKQNSQMAIFGVLFTLIALVALIALVFVRSRAQDTQLVNQITNTQSVQSTFDSQDLLQYGTTVVADHVALSNGGQSDPLTLTVDFTNLNGIANAIIKPNAVITILGKSGTSVPGPTLCNGADGRTCYTQTFAGDAQINSTNIVEVLAGNAGTKGRLTIPNITLPYYAVKGTWTFWWKIDMVDAAGNLLGNAYTLDNLTNNTPLTTTVDAMVAIQVNTSNGTLAEYKTWNNGSLSPNQISNAVTVTVTQKGSVNDYVGLVGEVWTTTTGGANLPVSITHFTGGTLDDSSQSAADSSYAAATVQVLSSENPPAMTGSKLSQVKTDNVSDSWTVPTSSGPQDSVSGVTDGSNAFDTMIQIPAGSVGSYTSHLTVIASEAL